MGPIIEIVEYESRWPDEFATIAAELRPAFGADALRVDHIGSTSVPGLAAKDIIDVQITVARFNDAEHQALLESAGFEWAGPIVSDHCPPGMALPDPELEKRVAFRRTPIRANVHIRIAGRFNQQYPLLCRDYLRAHPDAAMAYAAVKRALAAAFPDDVESYYAIKDPVFDVIMSGAREWAANTGWQVSDSLTA
jgi:GrpB-like predicted nucleotidyltransferase (UPF0157 family)